MTAESVRHGMLRRMSELGRSFLLGKGAIIASALERLFWNEECLVMSSSHTAHVFFNTLKTLE